jgi:RNA polymerase sigma-70 factor (ECF subfamily)
MRPLPETDVVLTYRETVRPLYAYLSRRVGADRGLAEDLVQETWTRALDDWARNGIPKEPLAWLTRVAHNALVSHFRRVKPESLNPALLEVESLSTASPDSAAIIGWGIAQLRRSHAEILEAFYFEEKSVREIAAAHSISERAVEGRLRRAREKLKKKLGQRLGPVREKGGTENVRPTRAQ